MHMYGRGVGEGNDFDWRVGALRLLVYNWPREARAETTEWKAKSKPHESITGSLALGLVTSFFRKNPLLVVVLVDLRG